MKKILVVGSLNMDSVIETPSMPMVGETISGKNVSLIPGGKGANQSYAIGKLGGNISMIGAVGDDSFGTILKNNLETVGVNTEGIVVLEGETTGQAFITVDDNGDNSIILIAGTNGKVTCEMIQEKKKLIEDCDIVVMQLEIPLAVVEYVKDMAVELGKLIVVDPAPAVTGLPESFWKGISYIKPNETELEILTGRKLKTHEELIWGAREMIHKGVGEVIVTLGSEGCLHVTDQEETFFPANKVKAVDTTAAGDCFTAAFVLALSEGRTCDEAISFGQQVSAISVTRKGAQTSIPGKGEILNLKKGGDM